MAVKKIIFFAFSFLLNLNSLSSQEAAGLIFGQFNGVNATKINPSFAFKSSNKWDVQIGGGHVFLQTDYAYINKSNLPKTATNTDDIEIHNYPDDPIENAEDLTAVFKINNTDSYGFANAEVLGPSVMFNINPNVKLGLFTRGRAYGSSASIPGILNYYPLNSSLVGQQYDSDKFSGAAAAWNEIGILYAQKIDKKVDVGFSFKYNVGVGGGHFDVDKAFSYISNTLTDVSALSDGTFTVGYSGVHDDGMNGQGFGIDAGVTIHDIFGKGTSLGISLLDLGYTNMNGQTRVFAYDENSLIFRDNYNIITDPYDLIEQLEVDFRVLESDDFFIIDHPTTISLQYSHPINERIKIDGAINQRIKVSNTQVLRPNSVVVAGVYETKNLSVFLPISLTNYKRMHSGLAVRTYFLTIGSDDLGSLFGQRNFNGTDFYVNLNLYPFLSKKKSKDEPCFVF